MDRDFRVFVSKKRLYGLDKKCNHRLHNQYEPIEQVFTAEESDSSLVYPLLATGATAMKETFNAARRKVLGTGPRY